MRTRWRHVPEVDRDPEDRGPVALPEQEQALYDHGFLPTREQLMADAEGHSFHPLVEGVTPGFLPDVSPPDDIETALTQIEAWVAFIRSSRGSLTQEA